MCDGEPLEPQAWSLEQNKSYMHTLQKYSTRECVVELPLCNVQVCQVLEGTLNGAFVQNHIHS